MQKEIVNVKAVVKLFPRMNCIGSVDLAIVKLVTKKFRFTISAKKVNR